jgi:hypothetical protein
MIATHVQNRKQKIYATLAITKAAIALLNRKKSAN